MVEKSEQQFMGQQMMDPELQKQLSSLSANDDELAKQQEELKKLEQELEESKYLLTPTL